MARKTREDTLKTVTAILDAAEAVFIEHGVAKATIAQIAERAGVSKGAVYGHYKDKIEVCVAVCLRGLEQVRPLLQAVRGGAQLEALQRLGVDYVRLFFDSASYRNVGEILYIKCENSPEYAPVQRIRMRWERQAFRITGTLLRKAIAAGELPATTDPELGNIYLHSILDGLICAHYYTDRLSSSQESMRKVEAILGMGIAGLRDGETGGR